MVFSVASNCWALSVNVPNDYGTIQEAIDALVANPLIGDTVIVSRGTYAEDLTINGSITLQGEEAAATFLHSSNNTLPAITVSNTNSVVIRNFTFDEADSGITVTTSSGITITSNVFYLNITGGAITTDTSSVNVVNNTFYSNDIAIGRGSDATTITNNIFHTNNTAISPDTITTNVSFNCFYNNTVDGVIGSSSITANDPLFVTLGSDFHLKQNSPCIDQGTGTDIIDNTTADIGAYGGDYADIYPMQVKNVTAQDDSTNTPPAAIKVSWQANNSYLVTHTTLPGGYKLYYDSDVSGAPYNGADAVFGTVASPINVGNVLTYTLSGLSPVSTAPSAPTITGITPSNNTLLVEWNAVSNATGYRVYYGINNVTDNTPIDVNSGTSYTLTGLTNNTTYQVAVTARLQPTYYISVSAYDSTGDSSHESQLSDEVVVKIGSELESALSTTETAIPEEITPYPTLPDEGCFIATAAFGFYDAPQVQLLRDFRDQYLLTNAAGSWFVKQYYTYGPSAARYINQNPDWKPVVRVLLLPLIALSWLLVKAEWWMQCIAVVSFLSITVYFIQWRLTRRRALRPVTMGEIA